MAMRVTSRTIRLVLFTSLAVSLCRTALAAPVINTVPGDDAGVQPTGPAVGRINGAVPATQVAADTTATTSGATNPALYATGLTGASPNAIVVNGGGLTAQNLSGTGLGIVTAMNGGSINLGTGATVTAQGSGSASNIIGATGLYARYTSGGFVPTITATNVSVSATGDKPYAVYAHTDSLITLNGLTSITVSSDGTQGWGMVSNASGVINAQDVNITMGPIAGVYGAAQSGISAFSAGQVNVSGTATVNMTGLDATAVFARYANSVVNINNLSGTVTSTSAGAEIAGVNAGATVNVTGNASVQANAAAAAYGLFTSALGTINFSGTSTLTVNGGTSAYGLSTSEGGTISLANSTMTVSSAAGGNTAVGIESEAAAAGTQSAINVSNSTINSGGDGIRVTGGTLNLNLTNTKLTNATSNAINVLDNAGVGATLNLVADAGSQLSGTATKASGSTSNLTLSNGSTWNLTGDSNLTSVTNNSASLIAFSAPSAQTFKTLSVNSYTGGGGIIGLNTVLAGDGAASDRLVIDGGTATGTSKLRITNVGGQGALTTANGINVVNTINNGTTAAGAFSLDGRAVAGVYEYSLFRGSVDGSNPDAWYLRSEQQPAPGPVPNPDPPRPVYRADVASYLANQRLSAQMFVHSLHDRLGEVQYVEGQGFNAQTDKARSGWLRMTGGWEGSRSGDGTYKVSTNSFLLQGGGDLAKWQIFGPEGRGHLGLMGSYGAANSDASAQGNPYTSRGRVEGWAVGVYGTWFQNDERKLGAYVDTWFQYGWFNNRVEEQLLPTVKYNAHGLAASGEVGYAIPVKSDWVIEPQGQVIYIGYNQNDVNEQNGTLVTGANSSGWVTRLGIRFYRTFTQSNDTKWQPFATINWWHNSVTSSVAFDGLPVDGLYPQNRYELKLGLNTQFRKRWTAWANVSGSWSTQSYYQYALRGGVKYTW
ncbi:autotransporter family protein [Pandoraea sputorum]|uniref:autotransporter family protein n=1 Tax=Pandoraea sputorum TaxID=93222 RepID=UPI0012574296|nr:autotransporter outer membrane beta-barrel domain-containing protein [Pandoraea sputorum]VVE75034.1 Outer membrane protein IcsA autotransporter [Pandoraea sputorum]